MIEYFLQMNIKEHLPLREMKTAAKIAGRSALAMALTMSMARIALADGGGTVSSQMSRVTYTQCGGELKGEPIDPSHTVFVLKFEDGSYDGFDLGVIGGECGNVYTEPDSAIQTLEQVAYQDAHGQPVSLGTADGRTFYYTRRFPQCGGRVGRMVINPAYTVLVNEFTEPETGGHQYSWRTVGRQPGQCGNIIKGDGNGDGEVDFSDIPVLLKNWMKQKGIDPDFPDSLDMNDDGVINSFDHSLLQQRVATAK